MGIAETIFLSEMCQKYIRIEWKFAPLSGHKISNCRQIYSVHNIVNVLFQSTNFDYFHKLIDL